MRSPKIIKVPTLDWKGNLQFDGNGLVVTEDQYAIFNQEVHRAGYISNLAFGYIGAASGLTIEDTLEIAEKVSLFTKDRSDNKDDLDAIKDGYRSFKDRFLIKRR